jgi:hypothetical protein
MQCPLVLLEEVHFTQGKALGSEEGKGFREMTLLRAGKIN